MRHARTTIRMLLLALAVLCGPARAEATAVPERTAWAIDQTGVLQAATLARLDHDLADYARRTGREIVVLLVPTTGEESLDGFGERVIEAWELGGSERNAAALVWAADGYIGIGAGHGVADVLTPEIRRHIQTAWIVPRFGRGDADGGILEGAEHIIRVLDGQPVTADDDASATAEADAILAGEATGEPPAEEGMAEGEAPAEPDVSLSIEVANPSPGWAMVDGLAGEVVRIAEGFSRNGGSMFRAVLDEARQQWAGLDGALSQAWHGRARAGELARVAVIVLGALAVLAFVAASKGRLRTGAFLLGVPGAPALWFATGFTALSVVTFVVSLAFVVLWPVLKPLLKAIAVRDDGDADAEDERRRREAILAATSKKPPLMRSRPATPTPAKSAAPSRSSSAHAATPASRPAHVTADARPPAPSIPHAGPLTPTETAQLQATPELVRLLATLDGLKPRLERIRLPHLLIADFVLFVLNPALGVLAIPALVLLALAGAGGPVLDPVRTQLRLQLVRAALRAKHEAGKR